MNKELVSWVLFTVGFGALYLLVVISAPTLDEAYLKESFATTVNTYHTEYAPL